MVSRGGQAPPAAADLPQVSVIPPSAKAGDSALEALVDAAAGILSADSLPGTLGRIAHHLAALVPHDDLSVYEIEEGGSVLRPVFAVGDWVEEIMAEEIPLLSGVTGWAVRNRRTRNVPNTLHEPLCTVVTGTDEVAEAFVAVPLIAHDRVVGSLNVYRTGADVPFSVAEVELVERFATMAALAYDSARQRDLLREEVRTDSLTGLLNHRGCQECLRSALEDAAGPVSVVVIDLDHFKRINDTLRPRRGRPRARARRRRAARRRPRERRRRAPRRGGVRARPARRRRRTPPATPPSAPASRSPRCRSAGASSPARPGWRAIPTTRATPPAC